MTRTAKYCVLSAIVVMLMWFVAYKYHTETVWDGYEATATQITELLSKAHSIYLKNKIPPADLPSCVAFDAGNNVGIGERNSSSTPILDHWGQAMVYSVSKNSITLISSGADLKMGTSDDISGVLTLSENREIVVRGKYKENSFVQLNALILEDEISSANNRDKAEQRDK